MRDEKPDKVREVRGSPQDYKDMYKRFVEVFDQEKVTNVVFGVDYAWNIQYCLLYTSPSPRDVEESRMPSSA